MGRDPPITMWLHVQIPALLKQWQPLLLFFCNLILNADISDWTLHISFVSVEYNSLNSLVSEAFIRFFLETIGHYSLFITEKERGERVFQREAFRKSVASKSIRRFLGVFMESQMFAGFIQDRELRKTRAKGSFSKIPHQSVKRAKRRCSNTDP